MIEILILEPSDETTLLYCAPEHESAIAFKHADVVIVREGPYRMEARVIKGTEKISTEQIDRLEAQWRKEYVPTGRDDANTFVADNGADAKSYSVADRTDGVAISPRESGLWSAGALEDIGIGQLAGTAHAMLFKWAKAVKGRSYEVTHQPHVEPSDRWRLVLTVHGNIVHDQDEGDDIIEMVKNLTDLHKDAEDEYGESHDD